MTHAHLCSSTRSNKQSATELLEICLLCPCVALKRSFCASTPCSWGLCGHLSGVNGYGVVKASSLIDCQLSLTGSTTQCTLPPLQSLGQPICQRFFCILVAVSIGQATSVCEFPIPERRTSLEVIICIICFPRRASHVGSEDLLVVAVARRLCLLEPE